MSNNLDVRLFPNGHPYLFLPQINNPQLPPLLQLPPHIPSNPDPSPLSSLTHFAQVSHQQFVSSPFDQVLNMPFVVPSTQPTVPMSLPFMDIVNAQLLAQPVNPLLPLGIAPMQLMPVRKTPVPLMSLRIPTPPSLRAHPYQTSRDRTENVRRPRQRNPSVQSQSYKEKYTSDRRNSPYRPYELLGEALRKEAEKSEKESR
uniref:Uncharacterized protein n=1 Tax=Caenorhabditis tropicalis TaxID=1561998 RepID=A0A1I7URL1_9PELO